MDSSKGRDANQYAECPTRSHRDCRLLNNQFTHNLGMGGRLYKLGTQAVAELRCRDSRQPWSSRQYWPAPPQVISNTISH